MIISVSQSALKSHAKLKTSADSESTVNEPARA